MGGVGAEGREGWEGREREGRVREGAGVGWETTAVEAVRMGRVSGVGVAREEMMAAVHRLCCCNRLTHVCRSRCRELARHVGVWRWRCGRAGRRTRRRKRCRCRPVGVTRWGAAGWDELVSLRPAVLERMTARLGSISKKDYSTFRSSYCRTRAVSCCTAAAAAP